jgi:hypothetical protein
MAIPVVRFLWPQFDLSGQGRLCGTSQKSGGGNYSGNAVGADAAGAADRYG